MRSRAAFFLILTAVFFRPETVLSEETTKTTKQIIEEEESWLNWLGGETVIVGASKYEQKISEAPASVSVITARDIKRYGYRTLADILKSIRSFYVTYDRDYNFVGTRGFGPPGDYNTRVLLLVDGHRINDDIYDQAYIGTDFILDVDLIDKIEVIRGPSSSIYGTNAFFGVINVITKQAKDLSSPELSGELFLFDSTYDAYKLRGSYGHKFEKGPEVVVSASGYDSKGQRLYFKEFDQPPDMDGWVKGGDYDNNYSFFSKAAFQDFSFHAAFVSREKGVPTGAWGTMFGDKRTSTNDDRGYLELKYKHSFEKQIDLQARLYYDHYKYRAYYVYDNAVPPNPPEPIVYTDRSWGEWLGAEVQATKTLYEKHKITVGMELQDHMRQDMRFEDPFEVYMDDKRSSTNWALYAQGEIRPLKDLLFNAGLRHDNYKSFGGTTNPRLAAIYNLYEKTTLKALYGIAFRAPNNYEFYYQDNGTSQKGNPDLKPETINTYEAVLEQGIGERLRATVSAFYYNTKDLIVQEVDPADNLFIYKNVGEVNASGAELELDGRWDILEGRFSYTYQDARDKKTKSLLINSPTNMVRLNLSAQVIEKLSINPEIQFMSKRKTITPGEYAGAFTVVNLTLLSQDLAKNLTLSFSIYNLFNEKYGDPGAEFETIKQDGRNLRLKLTYSF